MGVAVAALAEAEQGKIRPARLSAVLLEFLNQARTEAAGDQDPLLAELREFVELDLSDFAYSLAIHDQPALERLKTKARDWKERLLAAGGQGFFSAPPPPKSARKKRA